jgi:hypothetical protein
MIKRIGGQFRQGDVLIERYFVLDPGIVIDMIDAIPEEIIGTERTGRVVLAYGEATGHAHALCGTIDVIRVKDQPPETPRYLRVVGDLNALLSHEEHGAIPVAPGLYRVTRQVEWTDEDEPRYVAD